MAPAVPGLLWLALWLAAPSLQAATPEPYRAEYRLSSDDTVIGTVRQELVPLGGDRFRLSTVAEPSGLLLSLISGIISETSELARHGDHLRPLHYTYHRSGFGRNRDVAITFDWSEMRAQNDINGDAWAMQIAELTFDKHSLLLAVVGDLARGNLSETYAVADGGRLKYYHHDDLGTETVSVPLGTFETRRLRQLRAGKQLGTEYWHAAALGHLPVIVTRTDGDGRHLQLQMTAFEHLTSAPEPGEQGR